jgi:DNA-directed RNA polymerase specialized sigma24 family protein
MTEPKKTHYVENRPLYEALAVWKKDLKRAQRNKLPKPPLPDFVAECMMKMANRLSQKAGFVNYTFREDMVGDALESCLRYIHNFNPDKYKNAFAYITQIIHNAFIRRIQKEQKQLYVKMIIVDNADFAGSYEKQEGDTNSYNNSYVTYLQENKGDVISKFENWKESKKTKAAAKKKAENEIKLIGVFEEEAPLPDVTTKPKKTMKPKAKAAGKKK